MFRCTHRDHLACVRRCDGFLELAIASSSQYPRQREEARLQTVFPRLRVRLPWQRRPRDCVHFSSRSSTISCTVHRSRATPLRRVRAVHQYGGTGAQAQHVDSVEGSSMVHADERRTIDQVVLSIGRGSKRRCSRSSSPTSSSRTRSRPARTGRCSCRRSSPCSCSPRPFRRHRPIDTARTRALSVENTDRS